METQLKFIVVSPWHEDKSLSFLNFICVSIIYYTAIDYIVWTAEVLAYYEIQLKLEVTGTCQYMCMHAMYNTIMYCHPILCHYQEELWLATSFQVWLTLTH